MADISRSFAGETPGAGQNTAKNKGAYNEVGRVAAQDRSKNNNASSTFASHANKWASTTTQAQNFNEASHTDGFVTQFFVGLTTQKHTEDPLLEYI